MIERLAHWVWTIDADRLAPPAIAQAKLLILDTIGCAFAALKTGEADDALAAIDALGGAARATVIGRRRRTSTVNAVFANGALVRVLDLNDYLIRRSEDGLAIGGHPSDNIPVGLAIGESTRSSGRRLLAATIVGYELYGRLTSAMDRDSPWDGTSASGLAAAAMAGYLMELDTDRLAHALALAAARCATPAIVRGGRISAAKSLANPLIAQAATFATLLAARGVTGPLAILDHRRGLHSLFPPGPELESLTAPLSAKPRILEAHIKAYPCLATGQAAVAAALDVHRQMPRPWSVDDVAHIGVTMADFPFVRGQQEDPDRRRPASREAADHSFPFLVAAALADGGLGACQFADGRWFDPAIVGLMERMVLDVHPDWNRRAPDSYPCTVKVVMRNGAAYRADIAYPPGHSRGRLDFETVRGKFEANAADVLIDADRRRLIDAVMRLEDLGSVTGVMRLCATARAGHRRGGSVKARRSVASAEPDPRSAAEPRTGTPPRRPG